MVQSFLERRCTAVDEKAALDAAEELTRVSPPILAYVPELWPDGTQKDICGWQVWFHAFSSVSKTIVFPRETPKSSILGLDTILYTPSLVYNTCAAAKARTSWGNTIERAGSPGITVASLTSILQSNNPRQNGPMFGACTSVC